MNEERKEETDLFHVFTEGFHTNVILVIIVRLPCNGSLGVFRVLIDHSVLFNSCEAFQCQELLRKFQRTVF